MKDQSLIWPNVNTELGTTVSYYLCYLKKHRDESNSDKV